MNGIDISIWQKNDYKRLIDKYGDGFVICRATFDFTVDSMCDVYYQYAKKAGKKLGVYFFPLTGSSTPERSAQWCYDQVKGYVGEAIFFLDWESYQNTDVANVGWALKWLQEFERLSGVKPLIYMNQSCESTYNWSIVVKNNNGLWLANYGTNNGLNQGYKKTKHWAFVACHQYTSVGDSGRGLDRDYFNGDGGIWDKYAKVNKPVENSDKTVEKPVENSDKTVEKPVENSDKTVEKPVENSDKEIEKSEKILENELAISSTESSIIKKVIQKIIEWLKNLFN